MKKCIQKIISTILVTVLSLNAMAQMTLTGQIRTRTEVRNGLGNLVTNGSKTAAFTSQRSRINFGYKWDKLSVGIAVQDVRVWGQDASTISNNDGSKFMLHEAWADLTLANKADTTIRFKMLDLMSVKIGRQELIYDDVRLLGNLDWLQQARRHDMALLKTMHHGWQVDLGFAFNQNTDGFGVTNSNYIPGNVPVYVKNSLGVLLPTPAGIVPIALAGNAANNSVRNGTPIYSNPPNTNAGNQDYKSFTSLYVSKKINQTKFSALFFADNFGKYKLDSVGSATAGYIYGRRFVSAGATDNYDYSGVNTRYTYGLMVNHTIGNASGFGKIALQFAYYNQSGKDRDGRDLSAFHYTASATYQKGKFSVTPGYDVLSGDDANNPSATSKRFDPLYGTPHKHWGYMDYFYVGTGSPAGGLSNAYFKVKYASNMLSLGVDYHHFALHNNMKKADGTTIKKSLGSEIDFLLNYNMNKFTNIELGYSLMFASHSMPFAKAQATTDAIANTYKKTGTWLYAMIKFSPDFLFTKPVAI
ncbi:MAG: alginate export family protein, partial [Chitinophagaceae bacterium]